jgi:hypothetical protein
MSNIWLLFLPFAGLSALFVRGVLRLVPKSNEDFTFF